MIYIYILYTYICRRGAQDKRALSRAEVHIHMDVDR